MAIAQTIWVLQWYRYTGMARSQEASPEFWLEYRKIAVPSNGQVTEVEVAQLKELMAKYKLDL